MKKMLSIKEVAELVRLNEATVYKLAKEGKIPAVRFEKQWRVREEALEVWLRDHRWDRRMPACRRYRHRHAIHPGLRLRGPWDL